MPGRSSLLAVVGVLIAGAALAAPAPLLQVTSADASVLLPLPDDGRFVYRYRQSVYRVTVEEHQRVEGDRLRVEYVASADRRAVEYFRWPGEPRVEAGLVVQDAPDVTTPELDILIAEDAGQALVASTGSLDLATVRFPSGGVRVRPAPATRFQWLLALARR